MDKTQRLHLQKMISENNVEETTDKIRTLKHSSLIRKEVNTYLSLKRQYSRLAETNKTQFLNIVRTQCQFLFNNYTNLFNRLVKDELNLQILAMLLTILKRIEDGQLDQHEGSFEVGTLLKKLYIDSTLRRNEKRELKDKRRNKKKNRKKKKKKKNSKAKLTWEKYKALHLNEN